jgi:hypothetical protein
MEKPMNEKDADDTSEFDNAFSEFAKGDNAASEDADDDRGEEPAGDADAETSTVAAGGGEESEDGNTGEPSDAKEDPVAQLQKERDYWRHRYQSDEGRVSALQKQINSLQSRGQAQPTPAEVQQAMQSDGAWESFSKEYPEMAKAIETKFNTAVESRIAPLQQAEERRREQAAIAALQAQHSDAVDVVRSARFHQWLQQQPQRIQQLAKQTNDPVEMGFVLDTYKRFTAPAANQRPAATPPADVGSQRAQRVAASETVPSSRAPSGSKPIPKDDFDTAFEAYARRSRYSAR